MAFKEWFMTSEEIDKSESQRKGGSSSDDKSNSNRQTDLEKKVSESLEPKPVSQNQKEKWFSYVPEPAHLDKYEPNGVWLVQVPEGHSMINFSKGKLPEVGSRIPRVKPAGLRAVWGLLKLFESAVVVDQNYKSVHLSRDQVGTITSADGIELRISLSYNHRIADPISAVVRNSNYLETLNNIVRARLRGTIGKGTLKEIVQTRSSLASINIAPEIEYSPIDPKNYGVQHTFRKNKDGKPIVPWKVAANKRDSETDDEFKIRLAGEKSMLESLWRVGCELPEVFVKSVDIPDNLEKDIARQATADFEASGQIRLANAQVSVAQAYAKIAETLGDTPGAYGVYVTEKVLAQFASNPSAKYVILPQEILSRFGDIFSKK